MRCHSVFSWRCSSVPVHQVLVASERMASVRPFFVVDLLSGLLPKKPMSSTRFSYIVSLLFALVIGALESERGLLPRQGSAFREGHKNPLCRSRRFLGGNGKAEDAKPPGAGIPPKPCPMEGAETG